MKSLLLRILFFIILLLFIPPSRSNAFGYNFHAEDIISDNIFELIEDCLGKEKFIDILNAEKGRRLYFSYDLNGDLENITTGIIFGYFQKAYFLEEEWEQIFEYFHDLPPFPLSNPVNYLTEEKKYYDRIVDQNGYTFMCDCTYGVGGTVCPKDEQFYDWFQKNLYNYNFNIDGENPYSLFGRVHWYELRARYYDKYNSEGIRPTGPKYNWITGDHFKKYGYNWEKIPIKNYNVNIQVPKGSRVAIAPDTLSAKIDINNSTYISIQYTKGMPYTKIWDGETNPRERVIESTTVTSKYVLSSGRYENIDWIRMRYRYGITVTLYTKETRLTEFSKAIIMPITIVMRPRYKTIYLNY